MQLLTPYEYNVLLVFSGVNLRINSLVHGIQYNSAVHTLLRAGYLINGSWDYKISAKGKEYLASKQPKECA